MGGGRKHGVGEASNIRKVFWTLGLLCAAVFVADAFYHKHVHFEAEGWFGVYGLFGFVACVVLVLAAKLLGRILTRPEDYYDD